MILIEIVGNRDRAFGRNVIELLNVLFIILDCEIKRPRVF